MGKVLGSQTDGVNQKEPTTKNGAVRWIVDGIPTQSWTLDLLSCQRRSSKSLFWNAHLDNRRPFMSSVSLCDRVSRTSLSHDQQLKPSHVNEWNGIRQQRRPQMCRSPVSVLELALLLMKAFLVLAVDACLCLYTTLRSRCNVNAN